MRIVITYFVLIAVFSAHVMLEAVTFSRGADGGWSDVALWRDNSSGSFLASTVLPTDTDVVVVNSERVVSLDTDASIARLIIVNHKGAGTVNLDQPYSLRVESTNVGDAKSSGRGLLNINQGAFDMNGTMFIFENGVVTIDGGVLGNLFTGGTRRFEGGGKIELKSGRLSMLGEKASDRVHFDTALIIVSGGVLQSSQTLVGSRLESELRIKGDAGEIYLTALNQEERTAQLGTFRFVFNGTGVSTIEVENFMQLSAAKLIVNGAYYRGGSRVFTLFQGKRLASRLKSENVIVSGFGKEGSDWELIQDEQRGVVQLKVNRD